MLETSPDASKPNASKNFYARTFDQQRAVLAPMAGFSDAPFRRLCRAFGSAWAVTEMVSAKALVQGNLRGLEIGAPYEGEPNLVIQVFGGEPDVVAAGGRILWERYRPAALDLNMGCPVKKVTGKSCGSKLMQDPERAAEIVSQLSRAVPVAVSAKMRLGYDRVNALEVALALQGAGASLLTIHGRTAAQKYTGEADWEAVTEVAEQLEVPVVGSGDVTSRAQFCAFSARGLGVMVGRGAVGRPWIFGEFRGDAPPPPSAVREIVLEHARAMCVWYGSSHALLKMRGHLVSYAQHFPNAEALKRAFVKVTTLGELEAVLEGVLGDKQNVSNDEQGWGGP